MNQPAIVRVFICVEFLADGRDRHEVVINGQRVKDSHHQLIVRQPIDTESWNPVRSTIQSASF